MLKEAAQRVRVLRSLPLPVPTVLRLLKVQLLGLPDSAASLSLLPRLLISSAPCSGLPTVQLFDSERLMPGSRALSISGGGSSGAPLSVSYELSSSSRLRSGFSGDLLLCLFAGGLGNSAQILRANMHTSFLVHEPQHGCYVLRAAEMDQRKAARVAFPLPPSFQLQLCYELLQAERPRAGSGSSSPRGGSPAPEEPAQQLPELPASSSGQTHETTAQDFADD